MIEVKNTLNGELNASIVKEYPELEEITVTPTLDGQELKPSKYGYSKVTINEIPATDITITPTTKEQVITGLFDEVTVNAIEGQELNLNPSEEQQNFEGVFLGVNINPIQVEEITTDLDFSSGDAIELTAQEGAYIKKTTINKPTNLSPENIKSGETVCGIEGAFKPLDTSDATATAGDIRNGRTAWVNGEKIVGTLGEPYVILDYIESDGNQFINTNYNPTGYSEYEMNYSNFTGAGVLFGAYNNSWDTGAGLYGSTEGDNNFWYHYYKNTDTRIKVVSSADVRMEQSNLYINDQSYISGVTKSFAVNNPLYIFGANMPASGDVVHQPISMRLHKFIIKQNGVLLHDYKPVKHTITGEIGLYDIIEGKFVGNSGTGSFIAGPEISGFIDGPEV